ncbi:MAG: hypothetical protein J0I20_24330 [Chloroflexi bacterium]|nr:hypothetical protein [Chloroflexota bacterium]
MKSSEPRFRSTRKVWVLVLTMLAVSLTLVACDLAPSVTPVATTATIPSVPPTSIPSPLDLTSCNINISVKIPGPLSDTELQESRQQCLQSLDRNIQKWKAKNVAGYDITVFYQGTFFQPNEIYSYTVKNSQIVQQNFEGRECASCTTASPKPVQMTPTYSNGKDLTIDGLFQVVRLRAGIDPWIMDTYLKVTFEPEYGYPTTITFNSFRYSDSSYDWAVTSMKFNP